MIFFSSQQYFKIRTQAIQALKGTAEDPYPHKFSVDLSLTEFIEKFDHLQPGDQLSEVLSVAGKNKQITLSGKKMVVSDVSCLNERFVDRSRTCQESLGCEVAVL